MTPDEEEFFVRETRQLLADVEAVARDGRLLAQHLTQTIESVVKAQCDAIEDRMRALLARIDAVEEAARTRH
ncbi:MAG: hypothetical protein ABWZ40_06340 [Caulobacterales bacterium]